jgi:hypothetical protein
MAFAKSGDRDRTREITRNRSRHVQADRRFGRLKFDIAGIVLLELSHLHESLP